MPAAALRSGVIVRHGFQRIAAGLGTRLRYHEKWIAERIGFLQQFNAAELEPIPYGYG